MTEDDVIDLLRHSVVLAGSQKAWAAINAVSPQHLNDVLKRRRAPADAICRPLGIERVISYRRALEQADG